MMAMKINPFYVLPLIKRRQIGHGVLNNLQLNAYKYLSNAL